MEEWSPRIKIVEQQVAKARAMWGADEGLLSIREQELEVLLAQRDAATWNCRQRSPTVRHVHPPKSAKLGFVVRCESPLRNELRIEDLETVHISSLPIVDEQGEVDRDFLTDRYIWINPVLRWSGDTRKVDSTAQKSADQEEVFEGSARAWDSGWSDEGSV
jgi:hypothetical protein